MSVIKTTQKRNFKSQKIPAEDDMILTDRRIIKFQRRINKQLAIQKLLTSAKP